MTETTICPDCAATRSELQRLLSENIALKQELVDLVARRLPGLCNLPAEELHTVQHGIDAARKRLQNHSCPASPLEEPNEEIIAAQADLQEQIDETRERLQNATPQNETPGIDVVAAAAIIGEPAVPPFELANSVWSEVQQLRVHVRELQNEVQTLFTHCLPMFRADHRTIDSALRTAIGSDLDAIAELCGLSRLGDLDECLRARIEAVLTLSVHSDAAFKARESWLASDRSPS